MAEETTAAVAIGPRIRKSPFYEATRRFRPREAPAGAILSDRDRPRRGNPQASEEVAMKYG